MILTARSLDTNVVSQVMLCGELARAYASHWRRPAACHQPLMVGELYFNPARWGAERREAWTEVVSP